MAKTVYFDCFSGASGDMVLGALLDLGLPLESLRDALGSLAIDYGGVSTTPVLRAGIAATKFRVHERDNSQLPTPNAQGTSNAQGVGAHHHHGHTHGHNHSHEHSHEHSHSQSRGHGHSHHSLKEIAGYIERSALSRPGKERALHLFRRLAEAEATIHRTPLDKVHLHEVGALDSIIDIVGAVHGMEWLGADEIAASPLNVGSGTVECAHGVLPVPAPATTLLLRGVPVYAGAVSAELVTPTGALLVTEYATGFGPLPPMRLERIGYGAGDRDFHGHPNVLRLLVGRTGDARSSDTVTVVECEIDDMNPQLFGPLMDRLFASGALDVFYAPVQMKKNRPGTLVTVLAAPASRERIAGVLFAETTTIGVRYQDVRRECLVRETRVVDTPVGPVRFKVATREGRILNASPEFDDCARAAADRNLAVKDVQAIAMKAWLDLCASS